jgi:hypothetical protein
MSPGAEVAFSDPRCMCDFEDQLCGMTSAVQHPNLVEVVAIWVVLRWSPFVWVLDSQALIKSAWKMMRFWYPPVWFGTQTLLHSARWTSGYVWEVQMTTPVCQSSALSEWSPYAWVLCTRGFPQTKDACVDLHWKFIQCTEVYAKPLYDRSMQFCWNTCVKIDGETSGCFRGVGKLHVGKAYIWCCMYATRNGGRSYHTVVHT